MLPRKSFPSFQGLLLLGAVGYAGKFIEQSIAHYTKANHITFPNIEYVLWAIVIGLVIANTVGVPRIFQAGVSTYEFWLKAGIVLLGSRFLLGDILHLGGISLLLVAFSITLSLAFMHLLGRSLRSQAKADFAARDRLVDLRSLRDHRRQAGDRRRRRRRLICHRRHPRTGRNLALRLSR